MAADLLTVSRAFLALGLALMLAQGRLAWAAVGLSLAWITDLADGRLARAATDPTVWVNGTSGPTWRWAPACSSG